MLYVNRRGEFNDSMFEELEQFAQYQKHYCCCCCGHGLYSHEAHIEVNGVEVCKVEDIRMVYNIPYQVQLKCRVASLATTAAIAGFKKTDTVKLVIKTKETSPSKEPAVTINITHFFEDTEGLVPGIEKTVDVHIAPNKWLYVRGTEV